MVRTRSFRALAAAGLLALAGGCAPARGGAADPPPVSDAPSDARTLIHALHHRYADGWYRTLFFRQTVLRRTPGAAESPPPEVWAEYAEIPRRLRIDFDDGASGNGVIFAGDSLYVFRADSLARRAAQRNPLMLLAFDMYVQPPERTLALLREEGFDLERFHRATWEGRPAWVVGAEPGDLRSPQFWLDAERLLFVRLIQPTGPNGERISDIRFHRYEPLGGGWIAPEVVFLLDGEEIMREEYYDIRADLPLDPRLFDPDHWHTVGPRSRAEAGSGVNSQR
jgi:hypothetical protein